MQVSCLSCTMYRTVRLVGSSEREQGRVIVDLHSHYLPLSAVRGADALIPVRVGADGTLQLVMGSHTHALSEELTDLERQRETMARQGLDQKVLAVPPFCFQYELP